MKFLSIRYAPCGLVMESAGLANEAEIHVAPGLLTIRPAAHPCAELAEVTTTLEGAGLLDEINPTCFDDEAWTQPLTIVTPDVLNADLETPLSRH
jgi:hypothetical protein